MKRIIFMMLTICSLLILGCTYKDNTPNTAPIDIAGAPEKAAENTSDAEKILKNMTLEEKLGQLVIIGFNQETNDNTIRSYIEKDKVGGFILFKRNYNSFTELYRLTQKLKSMNITNKIPLFIAVDEEGGTVSRLPKGGTKFPDAQLIGKLNNTEITYKTGKTIGEELYSGGINMNFAPVLDILTNKNSRLLIKRAYGSDASTVYMHGSQFIKGIQSSKIIAVPKHFPGHGATGIDSHGKLPNIMVDKETLYSRELVPFKKCIDDGLDAVMVGHLAFPKIDESGLPATMSKVFLTDILRKDLGFKGIAITDEIEMYGFMNNKLSFDNAVITAFNAGVDVFVIGHTKKIQEDLIKTLSKAVASGKISKQRLDESVLRVINIKLKYSIKDKNDFSLEKAQKIFGSEENRAFLQRILKAIKNNEK